MTTETFETSYFEELPSDPRVLVLKSPSYGVTEKGKAFFARNSHRFGRFVRADMLDYTQDKWPLRLTDDQGKQLWLSGCSAGYGGEGPHGTLWVLKQAGFDRPNLDLFIFNHDTFTLEASQ